MNKLGLYIAKDTAQSGELHIDGNVRIEGSFIGNLTVEGNLFLGRDGSIEGEVHTIEAHIDGYFSGSLEATSQSTFTAKSRFHGILDTQRAAIAIGAELIGDVRIRNRR